VVYRAQEDRALPVVRRKHWAAQVELDHVKLEFVEESCDIGPRRICGELDVPKLVTDRIYIVEIHLDHGLRCVEADSSPSTHLREHTRARGSTWLRHALLNSSRHSGTSSPWAAAGASSTLRHVADFTIEFYEEEGGRQPFRQFLDDLDLTKRLAMIAATEQILAKQGSAVCKSSWGTSLGRGLFEFKVRHTKAEIRHMFDSDPPPGLLDQEGPPGKVLLRAFCHAYGDRIVLLLGGYDKGEDTSAKRQQKEIQTARKRLAAFQIAQQRAAKAKKR
jgi:hypothetical protein